MVSLWLSKFFIPFRDRSFNILLKLKKEKEKKRSIENYLVKV